MSEIQHVIDPDGEVIIVLRNANAPFAIMDSNSKTVDESRQKIRGENENEDDSDDDGDSETDDESDDDSAPSDSDDSDREQEPAEVRFQVSAKHMMLASPEFKRRLGPSKETSDPQKKGLNDVVVEDWDTKSLLILLNILHCRHRELPREMNVEQLAKIAVLIDHYECHESVEVFTDMWAKSIEDTPLNASLRELILRMLIAWVFRRRDEWNYVHAQVMKMIGMPIKLYGLPFPTELIDKLNQAREEAINGIISSLHESVDKLMRSTDEGEEGFDKCCFECGSSMLGALMKQMHSASLIPRPSPPFNGWSWDRLASTLQKLQAAKLLKQKCPSCPRPAGSEFRNGLNNIVEKSKFEHFGFDDLGLPSAGDDGPDRKRRRTD